MDVRIALAGDVMIARGIDQILRFSVDPELREPAVRDARDYVRLAEETSGPIPRNADAAYVWGDLLPVLAGFSPHATIMNVETSLTTSPTFAPDKRIHYRTHPENAAVIGAIPNPICTLANNHVLDFGQPGLAETLRSLQVSGIPACGAGQIRAEAVQPIVTAPPRIVVLSCCTGDSGVPPDWSADAERPGVYRITRPDDDAVREIQERFEPFRTDGATKVLSIHWGGNWGYDVELEQRDFAHALMDMGIADVVFGHSSHHPRPFELIAGRPVFYGCGDLINDYEGIRGHEEHRPDLVACYLLTIDSDTRTLADLRIVPFRLRRFRLEHAGVADAQWLAVRLDRENRRIGGPLLVARPDGLRIR
jgi:poly-gamma-glutamate capsule biosynthesis protein CapA/YwtB (metallophosphatase superfamily)